MSTKSIWCRLMSIALAGAVTHGCGTCETSSPNRRSSTGDETVREDLDAASRADVTDSEVAEPVSENLCIHQRRPDLGAPVHRHREGGGFIRLAECTPVVVIERDSRWLKIAFPEAVEGRTEGWISHRYAMDCGPCARDAAAAEDDGQVEAADWPPQPRGMCKEFGASGRERFTTGEPAGHDTTNGGARGRPGATVTVVSYNVWELYDGDGEPRYLSKSGHGGAPAEQFPDRLKIIAKALSKVELDVLLLQEVEGAEVACALAAAAWPTSGWSCYSTGSGGSKTPMNIAVATRLRASASLLRPVKRGSSGPRDALELSLEGAGGLTVTAVHLKSSRGLQGPEDCSNARRRMGAAAGLVNRYFGRSSVLIAGDFNIDPLDTGRTVYDRTAEILGQRDFERACPSSRGCATPTYPGYQVGSAIDLAFFRRGGRWSVADVRVLATAPHREKTSLGSDHLPLLIELRR